jgi:two-component system NtrC family sensor kinase
MPPETVLLLLSNLEIGQMLEKAALRPAGYQVVLLAQAQDLETSLEKVMPDLIILGDQADGQDMFALGSWLQEKYPQIPLILYLENASDGLLLETHRGGFSLVLQPPVRTNEVLQAVRHALQRRYRLEEWARREAHRNTQSLEQKLDDLQTLGQIGRKITSTLDLDGVLAAVVDAAVELTGAEEGSLLLIDETSGELYMRASRNFNEDFVQTFRLPVQDTLAGEVLRSGKPLLVENAEPQKIKTSYLVTSLLYVPIAVHGKVIGALEVDNRQFARPLKHIHVMLLSALADYAAIAIENARLYTHAEIERHQLETIINSIDDGVIVLDEDERLLLVNQTARAYFGFSDPSFIGRSARETTLHPDLLDALDHVDRSKSNRLELNLDDGRVLNAQITAVPGIGTAIAMQEITQLKELDHIKSEFVNTVSHDLRSPLTAILGYVELLDRVGPVNKQQKEFINRIQVSVYNITALINDLLDLGRIEAGFDNRKEIVPISAILQYAVDGLATHMQDKTQNLTIDASENLPSVLGSPVRLRQMLNNLLGNAMKYTPPGGNISLKARAADEQVIIEVADTGPGIPLADQPFVFDKFYRGGNISPDVPGTGLGLAIVKSIVDFHQGRIWVDSTLGKGTTFTVVLPIFRQ